METHQEKIDFGKYVHRLRQDRQLTLKTVADKLGIDVSLLSKIEHGERQIQAHMLIGLSDLFDLNAKDLQIRFLNQKIQAEYGSHPFWKEVVEQLSKTI